MGAVYQATDTRLGREVALKILPEKFVRDRQRMGRFQREAEVLASLSHPNISIIHGLEESGEVRALSFSHDRAELAFVHSNTETNPPSRDIWIWSMKSRSAKPFLNSDLFDEMYPEFSPDGRWLAYTSHASGKGEVHIQSYPELGKTILISTEGGGAPVWSGDGSELFYRVRVGRKVRMYAVEITVEEGELIPGKPVVLFEGNYGSSNPIRSYDVRKDGQRFLMRQLPDRDKERAMVDQYLGKKVSIVLNWFEELNRRVPTDE